MAGRFVCLALVACSATTLPAAGQDVDSLAAAMMARADSVRAMRVPGAAGADTTAALRSGPATLGAVRVGTWRVLAERRPLSDGVGDFGNLLARVPGSFLYDYGPDGWPDAWSPDGLDPAHVSLQLGVIPFDDPVTGMPAWDLLPTGPVDRLSWSPMDRSSPFVVAAVLPDTVRGKPLTEMRYRSGGSLQAVDVVHSQRRPVSLFGGRTTMDLQLGYAGAGAAGEYEGSRLRRKRQLWLAASSRIAGWTGSAMVLTNRHRVGAHAGVIPPGSAYDSIYDRLLAGVRHADAVRERYRSDVALGAGRFVAGRALSLAAYRTQHLLRYVRSGDSTAARVVRYGSEASLGLLGGDWPLSASVSLSRDAFPDSSALGRGARARSRIDASLAGSGARGPWTVEYGGGMVRTDGALHGSWRAGLKAAFGPMRLEIDAVGAPLLPSAVDLHGFGPTAPGLRASSPTLRAKDAAGRLDRFGAGLSLDHGAFVVGARAFALRRSGGATWVGTDAARAAVALSLGPDVTTRGLVFSLSYRDDAARGFHALASATALESSGGTGETSAAIAGVHPDGFGRAAAGWRGSLFGGDAIVDLRAAARAWSAMRGRQPATATGQAVLAYADSRDVPASVILDLEADIVVRGATLFLSIENLLSGTELVPGNQVVADYPYPERRWRFGVYWPIPD